MFKEYELVRLKQPVPFVGLNAGAVGAIVMVYDDPPAYEVEFTDSSGATIALLTLKEEEIERTLRSSLGLE